MDKSTHAVSMQPVSTGSIQMTVNTNPLMPRGVPRPWSSNLFDFFNDVPSCLLGLFCGPCHQCCLAGDMGESKCVPLCLPGAIIPMRALARGRHNIQGTLINDCCASTFCGPCVQCQLAREIDAIKTGRVQA